MSQKENIISKLHTRKGTWKIVVRITNLWEVRKQNSKQAIKMVLMDQTVFQGTKIGATLWQELFTEFRHKLHCGSSYLIQNLRIVDNQSKYRVSLIPLLVYFIRTTFVKEIQRPEIPPDVYMITLFADIISGVAPRHTLVGGITDDNGGSQSQPSQSNLVDKFLHNAQVVSIGEINNLKHVTN
ncbi:hypothetical protein JHK86_034992 [Glycine max]|nr:hypothetical protein JHK86_034992 [Glycine max]